MICLYVSYKGRTGMTRWGEGKKEEVREGMKEKSNA